MRILLTGASGFIGAAVAQALARRGHQVVPALRHPPAGGGESVQVDFASVPGRDWWRDQLAGFDAVVNTVGILREDAGRSFQALHSDAPAELFHGCVAAGVRTVVQVSSLGAEPGAPSRYHRSKLAADDVLRSLPLRGAVVLPSLVYGPGGTSAALFNKMAVSPLLPLPAGGRMLVHPVFIDDVVEGISALVEDPPPQVETFAFAGPVAVSMRDYLAQLRAALGEPGPLRVLPVPVRLFEAGAALAGRVPGSLLDGETAAMLLAGNATQHNGLPRLLRRAPRPISEFATARNAEAMRQQAALDLWLPVLRIALALMWVWTGIVSLGLYPVQESYALLARVGLTGALASVALYGAALLDLALGALCVLAPRRWRRPVWLAQAVLVLGYTVLITLFLPEYWLHPYGPLSKNLPLLAAIGLLWALERR
jgi:uncharacterized protein YbjT (DUF2867 family)